MMPSTQRCFCWCFSTLGIADTASSGSLRVKSVVPRREWDMVCAGMLTRLDAPGFRIERAEFRGDACMFQGQAFGLHKHQTLSNPYAYASRKS